jgi:hypothetical protein
MFMNGEQFYKDHILKWKKIGGSIRAYCKENQISYDSFQYWRIKKEYWQNKNKKGNHVSESSFKNTVSSDTSFIPVEFSENQDIETNGSLIQIRMEADGSIHISIGRKL